MASPDPRILVVDDERNMRRVLQALLGGQGYAVDAAENGDEARALLKRADPSYDLVVTDLRMPGCDGMELMHTVARRWPDIPVVFITAHGTVDTAVEAMRAGAFDFITKPFDEDELFSIVEKGLARREANRHRAYEPEDEDQTVTTDSITPVPAVDPLAEIIGESDPIKDLFSLLRKVAPSPTTVLIRGESGTGKELVARALHRLSDRAAAPFIAVNCTAIPENLFESELFGHEKGAFTGADRAAPGAFREADHGTLFLDELGELPLDQQTALLRVLERREVVPLGSVKPIPVDFRLVAATHRDLRELVALGDFREDLYYRLDVASLPVPPLRERVEDIPELARFFLRDLPRERYELTEAALDALLRHPWPGNVRELRNCLHRGALASETGVIGFRELELRERQRTLEAPVPSGLMARDVAATWEEPVSERARIVRALERAGGNRREAARMLGIARSTLYERMRRLGL